MARLAKTEEQRARNREYQARWRAANVEVQRERVKANNQRVKTEARAYIAEVKKAGCSRCPETHPATLDFHHKTDDKKYGIAKMVSRATSLKTIKAEIEKCELLCANCHRKEHATTG